MKLLHFLGYKTVGGYSANSLTIIWESNGDVDSPEKGNLDWNNRSSDMSIFGGPDDPYTSKGQPVFTLEQFYKENKGRTYHEIITQKPKSSGLYGGPEMRYVINPNDNKIMDMRHVMVVGYGAGFVSGFWVEIGQYTGPWFGYNTRSSAFDRQDYYSNLIGQRFAYYNVFANGNIYGGDWSTDFYEWLIK
jgi:hypothetical protein